jgi:DNA-directed RNA polymerase subunit RPC12/RpoP
MKSILYTCDACGKDIDLDKLLTIKIGKNAKHFCEECVSSKDLEVIIDKKK